MRKQSKSTTESFRLRLKMVLPQAEVVEEEGDRCWERGLLLPRLLVAVAVVLVQAHRTQQLPMHLDRMDVEEERESRSCHEWWRIVVRLQSSQAANCRWRLACLDVNLTTK